MVFTYISLVCLINGYVLFNYNSYKLISCFRTATESLSICIPNTFENVFRKWMDLNKKTIINVAEYNVCKTHLLWNNSQNSAISYFKRSQSKQVLYFS